MTIDFANRRDYDIQIHLCYIFLRAEKDNMTIPLPSGKISNEKGLLKQMFDNNLSVGTLGIHSIDEFL